MITVSIVIPSYKTEKTLDTCLQSLVSQKTDIKYEIIVVDSSPGDIADQIVKRYPNIIFVKEKAQTNPGIARNIGADFANGELLIFVDSDIVVSHDWVEKNLRYYREGHDIFIGSIDVWDRKRAGMINKIELFFEFAEFKPAMRAGTRWCLPSYTIAIKKELFRENAFRDMRHSQDMELTIRLKNQGNVLFFNPELKVFHNSDIDFRKLVKKIFSFGYVNPIIRNMCDVSCSDIVRIRPLAIFAVPFFTAAKFVKISYRNLMYNTWPDKALYLVSLPVIFILAIAWMLGFYNWLFCGDKST